MGRAFHLAQHADIRGDEGAEDLSPYELIVANAAALVELAHDGRMLPSFNARALPAYGEKSLFYNSLRDAMWPFILRDSEGNPVIYSKGGWYFDFTNLEGAKRLAMWIADNIWAMWPIRAVYLDDATEQLPLWARLEIPPDVRTAQVAAHPIFRDALIGQLSSDSRCPGVVVNCGFDVTPKAIAICGELEHRERIGGVVALGSFAVQTNERGGYAPNIDWTDTWELENICLRGKIRESTR